MAHDRSYQNAQANSDKQYAKPEHGKVQNRGVIELLSDLAELCKLFSDNPNNNRWLTVTVFIVMYHPPVNTTFHTALKTPVN